MKTCFHPRRLTVHDDHSSWSGILSPAGHRRKPCPSSKLSGAEREQSPEMIHPWMKCFLSGLTRLLPGWGKGRMSCPLSLSATHPHFTDEETKGSERGSHLPEVTQLGRDKAGLYEDWCMHERGGRGATSQRNPCPRTPRNTPRMSETVRRLFSPKGKHQCSHNHRETNRRQTISAKIVKSKEFGYLWLYDFWITLWIFPPPFPGITICPKGWALLKQLALSVIVKS